MSDKGVCRTDPASTCLLIIKYWITFTKEQNQTVQKNWAQGGGKGGTDLCANGQSWDSGCYGL